MSAVAVVDAPAPPASHEQITPPEPARRSHWVGFALAGLLLGTALLYLWGLGASGWANTYYSAAVQAGTKSWKAFFYGSTDSSNFITVDKTPASLWMMELSARVFGVNAWSILVPQALEGVAAVALLYASVKRWFGPVAGLLAGAVLALTPVSVLMFRYNNPDALLVLLLVASAYAMTRALEAGKTRWLVLTGAFVGFAFLAKELQAFLVLPALGLVYLVAGPPKLVKRLWQLVVLVASMIVAGGWWVAIVQLTPASARPYIGGSQNNSFWNVLFGYNGFGRLSGNENGSVGGAGPIGNRWGPTGLTRLFNSSFGGEAAWLLPTALVLMVAAFVVSFPRARTDRTRAAVILWGGWLLVTGIAFSYGRGIIHEYYTVALAPAIGALVAIGATTLWRERRHVAARITLGATVALTAWWTHVLLGRVPTWHPALRTFVLVAGLIVGVAIAVTPARVGRITTALAACGLVAALSGTTAYALATAAHAHSGAIPLSGPASAQQFLGGGGGPRGGFGGRPGFRPNFGGGNFGGGNFGAPPNFGGGNFTLPPQFGNGNANNGFPRVGGGGGGGGALGGLLNGGNPGKNITALLRAGAHGYRWAAATVGANTAAGFQLAADEPIMAIGGFNGTDPAPSLAQFQQYVAQHKIHYFIASGGFGGGGFAPGSSTSTEISRWVTANFSSRTVDGVTIYDLTSPSTGG
jgi:4-amino-4-deoxy-L-arabinose transferase-like glycosyltransferase